MNIEVTVEGNLKIVLEILFRRTRLKERRKYKKKELIDTACIILRDGLEIACAIARQNPLDNYNKIIGRKVALAKALGEVEFLKYLPEYYEHSVNKRRWEQRKHIWDVFHKTFGWS